VVAVAPVEVAVVLEVRLLFLVGQVILLQHLHRKATMVGLVLVTHRQMVRPEVAGVLMFLPELVHRELLRLLSLVVVEQELRYPFLVRL
jgi:hypothetical protein